MVLEKLSTSLKNTLQKIASAVFVDDTLLNELVKDIQRALLQSDVNVQLVFKLTEEIRKRAKEEKQPKGLTKKEQLINIVYEELTKFLGGEKHELRLEGKPAKIMLVGLFGSGKCVHGDSKLLLSNGDVVCAEELYNNYSQFEEKINEGKIIDITSQNLFVPSFNPITLKIENKKATHLWKLKGKNLLKISLDNGNDFSVRVTPEHPFFVLREGKVMKVRAEDLKENDYVATPLNVNVKGKKQYLFEDLKSLNLSVKGVMLDVENFSIKNDLVPTLKYTRNYPKLTQQLKNGITPIQFVEESGDFLIIKNKESKKFILFPTQLTEELAEFLGYVIGDGHLGKNYVQIVNEDSELINRVCMLSRLLFNIDPILSKDERTRAMYRISITSNTLVEVINKLFKIPVGAKGKKLRVPKKILKSEDDVTAKFLRAYFDCDAFAAKNTREIELSSESRHILTDVAYLLNRFGIISSISQKIINDVPYWRLMIRARYAEIYASKIGFLVEHKKTRSNNYYSIGQKQGCGKQDIIPLRTAMKSLRESLGFSVGEIQENVNSYGSYERNGSISKESLAKTLLVYSSRSGNTKKILNYLRSGNNNSHLSPGFINGFMPRLKSQGLIKKVNNTLFLTKKALFYQKLLGKKQYLFEKFKYLASSDVCWLKVKNIQNIGSTDFVYDLSVEDNHSFIADGIIVHNTTTTGKLAFYHKKRGLKVAIIGLDVYRPAAMTQLEQLGKQVNVQVFVNKTEKNPIKIYKQFEPEYLKYDLLILDTAGRDALSEDLIKEIKEVSETVKPNETLLVISADIGQAAQKQAQAFHDSCGVTGVIVTKMEGTAKGGGALSACAITNAPIVFMGVGEKSEDLESFNPKGFVGRLLGMGDIEALLEKAKEAISEEDAQDLSKKLLKGEFNLVDLYQQMEAMQKMGSISKLIEMIPGMGQLKLPKEVLEGQEGKLKFWKYAMNSMTKEELENPDLIDVERIERISKGSGVQVNEIRELMKQYKQGKKLIRAMKGDLQSPEALMKKMGKKGLKMK